MLLFIKKDNSNAFPWQISWSFQKIFQIPRGTMRWSLSLVKLKISPAFLKINSTTDIYSEFWNIFSTTISREVILLKFCKSSLFLQMWLILLFCKTNIITRKSAFQQNFKWCMGPEHLALIAWRKILFHCKHCISSLWTGWIL